MLRHLWVFFFKQKTAYEMRKERESGKVQKHCCTLLLVLPPIEVARFRLWNKRMYSWAANHRPKQQKPARTASRRARQEGGRVMVTEQAKQMAEFFASLAARTSKPDLDLATMRDINEGVHVCGTEPERVTYAEVDAGGGPPPGSIPTGSHPEHERLH